MESEMRRMTIFKVNREGKRRMFRKRSNEIWRRGGLQQLHPPLQIMS